MTELIAYQGDITRCPIAEATLVAVRTIREWLAQHPETALETVTLVAFSDTDLDVIESTIASA